MPVLPTSATTSRNRGTVVLGVAASDAHAVANQLIAASLRLAGFVVVNLGVCTPLQEFAAAVDDHPETLAVAIGSMNGHAYDDLSDLPLLRAAGRLPCPVLLGGNLAVGGDGETDHARLRALGVDHIVADPADLPGLLTRLAERARPDRLAVAP
ncbi:cobalamin-dependent protein [Nonomuraea sp. NPDC059023]|uniref:cobalamin-dependent protein n=1 Tax=unclassified Nonomuraea TaxID=2593643 RepID=UPI00368BB011